MVKLLLTALVLWVSLLAISAVWLVVLWWTSPERYLAGRRQARIDRRLVREAQRQAHVSACRTRESYSQIKYREVP